MKIDVVASEDKDAIMLYGGNLEAFKSKDEYVILVGGAGTGKTFALCLKMHLFALAYPGVQILLTRKNIETLRKTVVKTYQTVLKKTNTEHLVRVLGESRPTNFIYPYQERNDGKRTYKGKSEIILAPLDSSGKALGAEYDMIYVNQPDVQGVTLEEFKLIKSRARLENGPHRSLLADPNPSYQTHWLLEEEKKGAWKMFTSSHKDNPALFNQKTQQWTDLGVEQMRELASQPGRLRESLYEGKWYSNAGMVFAGNWDPAKHLLYLESAKAQGLGVSRLIEEEDRYVNCVPQGWHHYLCIDWGGTDPFTAILIAKHPEMDLMIAHKHIYITETDIYEVSRMTAEMISGYNIKTIIADRGRAESTVMESYLGLPITTAKKGGGSGIDSVLICQAELNSDRWLFVPTEQSLVHTPDPLLVAKNKPMGVDELSALQKDEKTGGIAHGADDHFFDAWKYFCRYWVELTNSGYRREKVLFY